MTVSAGYCRYCEQQIEGCLAAAREQEGQRAYFLGLAGRWMRLARDLESRHACGDDCPLRHTCRAALPAIVEPEAVEPAAAMPHAVSVRPAIPTA